MQTTQLQTEPTASSSSGRPDKNVSLPMVPKELLSTVWDEFGVGDMIRREEWRSGGRWDAEHVLEELQAGSMQLWLAVEDLETVQGPDEADKILAAVITDLRPYPNGFPVCSILLTVGRDAKAWIPLMPVLENWAKRSGCQAMEIIGRMGWKRLLDADRWKATATFYEKAL